MKKTLATPLALLVLILLIGGFFVYQAKQQLKLHIQTNETLQSELTAQASTLEELKRNIDLLIADNETVATQIEQEKQQAASRQAQSEKQIEDLQSELAAKEKTSAASVTASWQGRVGKITCKYDIDDGQDQETTGSVVLFKNLLGQLQIVTNKHVLIEDEQLPTKCEIFFANNKEEYNIKTEDIVLSPEGEADWARAVVADPDAALSTAIQNGAGLCQAPAQIGDEIVVLGFPKIGSADSLTAAEGIISGIEEDFYVTSAKVETGNSGGAAILAKNNCYLGTPTFVRLGQVETFARILKHERIGF